MSAPGAFDFHEIARPKNLDPGPGRIERNPLSAEFLVSSYQQTTDKTAWSISYSISYRSVI
jgi:hypothetical protein